MDAGRRVLGCAFEELAALNLDWCGCLPAVHPVNLFVITVVHVSCPLEPDPWVRADVYDGKLINIGHLRAKHVAVFTRSLKEIEGFGDCRESAKALFKPYVTGNPLDPDAAHMHLSSGNDGGAAGRYGCA